jgi:cytochrome c oxidase subunit 2
MARIIVIYLACIVLVSCVREQATVSRSPASFNYLADGRSIFQTGRNIEGVQITAQSAPLFNKCSACHRADGSGGIHLIGGAVGADLRHRALVTDQKHPYSLALLERAISTGVDSDGQQLNLAMPRWRLSQRDIQAVAQYVLTQLR